MEDKEKYRTEAVGAKIPKAKKPRPGDHTDEYDYYDVNASAPYPEIYSAKHGSHADHYSRWKARGHRRWPSIEEVVGNDLEPSDEKRQWPAFKRHTDWNKDFEHFKDREDWPFRNNRRKFPWHKTDSQRFWRNDYDDYDKSSEQASRRALLDGYDPRAYEDGPYRDYALPRKRRQVRKANSELKEAMDVIDGITKDNDVLEKQLKTGHEDEEDEKEKDLIEATKKLKYEEDAKSKSDGSGSVQDELDKAKE